MSNDASIAKIKMLNASLQCFVSGLIGLLPIIGLPFVMAAFVWSGRVRAGQRQFWNAGRHYWIWGVILAGIGIFLSGAVIIFSIFREVNREFFGE